MKRPIRFVIILISIAIVVAGIGFWRHHYLKVKNAEPINVYKDTLIEPDTLPKGTSAEQKKADKSNPGQPDTSPKDVSVQSEDGTDVAMETGETTPSIDDSVAPEETDDVGDLTVHTVFTDIIVENLPPKAAAALKEYDAVQLASDQVTEELKALYKVTPIDFDAIGMGSDKLGNLHDRRDAALEILSKYSKQASDKLDAILAQSREANKIIEDLDEGLDVSVEEMMERIEAARERVSR